MGFGKDGKGFIIWDRSTVTLGALAADDVIGVVANSGLAEDFRILRTDYFINHFPGAAENSGLLVGISDAALTDAEVEECIESTPVDSNDFPESEQSMRPVWPLELYQVTAASELNSLSPRKGTVKLRWTFTNGNSWRWWVFNAGNTITTGGEVSIIAKHFGVWVR